MADNKKYYYLKVKDNFYDSEEMILLQNMQDGYLYSDILMKLYLRSLKNNGKLMFKDVIPYTPQILSQVVRHQVGTVEKALTIFKQLGLIEILDTGAIYMLDIQNFIGESSTEADRIRKYRQTIKSEQEGVQMLQHMYDESTPEIEKDIEKDIEIKKDIDKKEKYGQYGRVKLTLKEYERLCEEFNKDYIDKQINLLDEYIESNNNKNRYTNFNLVLRRSIKNNWFKDSKTPEWFDKEYKKQEVTAEERAELEEILKGFK